MLSRLFSQIALCAILACGLAGSQARAADVGMGEKEEPKGPQVAQVGNDDIFGFTSASELGDAGDTGFANENDGRIGKRSGSYGALNAKYQLSYAITPDFWVAGSGFLARNRVNNVPGFNNRNSFDFDGISIEIARRLITRSESNPLGITASIEPRWGRVDGETGLPSNSYGFGAKLFIDRVIVPGSVFWGSNVIWGPQWSKDPLVPGNNLITSTDLVSTALSWQFAPGIFLGAETRYFTQFARITPNRLQGQALYAGPTLLWKYTEKIVFNATFQPQIWGRSSASPNLALDMDNFERSLFRLKLAWQLN